MSKEKKWQKKERIRREGKERKGKTMDIFPFFPRRKKENRRKKDAKKGKSGGEKNQTVAFWQKVGGSRGKGEGEGERQMGGESEITRNYHQQ